MNQQRESNTVEHYTPHWVIDVAAHMLSWIDLDPATSEKANTIVKANKIYTQETDGLVQEWKGNVFCNPPGQPSKWFRKAVEQYKLDNLQNLFFVVYSIDRLPTILKVCKQNEINPLVIIPHKRIEYLNSETLEPQTQPLHGSAFIYFGRIDITPSLWSDKYTILRTKS